MDLAHRMVFLTVKKHKTLHFGDRVGLRLQAKIPRIKVSLYVFLFYYL
jgi:hypothetical protein